jgi:hypothetical protein
MIDKILEDRQEQYGDAEVNFAITGRIWGAMLQMEDIPAWQVALMMDAFKSVRCIANPDHKDSWRDKLGYIQHGIKITGA